MRDQIDSLTPLRGIAALLVVLFHYAGPFLPNLHHQDYTFFVAKGYLWVDFFFLLSGFVIMHAYGEQFRSRIEWRSFKGFVFARVARLYPLHLTILAGFILLELLRAVLLHGGVADLQRDAFTGDKNPAALLENLAMLQGLGLQDRLTWNAPAWSIGAEWFAYLTFPALAALLLGAGWRCCLLVCLAAGLGLALISHGGLDLDRTNDLGLLRCLSQFSLGAVLYLAYRTQRLRRLHGDLPCLLLAAAVVLLLHLGAPDLLLPPLFALLILALAGNEGRMARALSIAPLRFLGAISYSVYMSHMLVLETLQVVSRALWGHGFGEALNALQSSLALGLLLVVILLLSAMLYRGIEQPLRQALRNSRFAQAYVYGQ